MQRRVTTAPAAAAALGEARRWLLQPGSGPSSARRWQALRDARRSLRDHPYIGRVSDEHPNHRLIVVVGCRVIYEVTPDTGDAATAGDVRIVAVFGPGQP